jgi:hypothetical protein
MEKVPKGVERRVASTIDEVLDFELAFLDMLWAAREEE